MLEFIYSQPPRQLASLALQLETPAIIYDLQGLADILRRVQEDLQLLPAARLNLALKACHTLPLLEEIASRGVGCDVASIQELRIARRVGFHEISATAPAWSPQDLAELREAEVVPDIDSLDQLALYGKLFPGSEVGLRVRIPLPREHESASTFGADSRFGMLLPASDAEKMLSEHRLRVTRLHIHCGQSTPESLRFKLRYLLDIAKKLPDLHTVDLGGGLYHFYIDRAAARTALAQMQEDLQSFSQQTSRELALRLEPGAALLGQVGYLVAQIRAVSWHDHFQKHLVTVDASAWNLAPWHRPQVFALPARSGAPRSCLIAGNTLYEGDFFGSRSGGPVPSFELSPCAAGDRLVLSGAGAYTLTNARRFHRLPLPAEYALSGGSTQRLEYRHEQ